MTDTAKLSIVCKETLPDVLWHAFQQNFHADCSNAAIHCAVPRFSPLTFRLAEQLWNRYPSYQVNDDLKRVIYELGQYEEDPGR